MRLEKVHTHLRSLGRSPVFPRISFSVFLAALSLPSLTPSEGPSSLGF